MVDAPAFHHQGDPFALPAFALTTCAVQAGQVPEGIAVHDQQVGVRTRHQAAQPALLAQHLGTDQGSAANDLQRRLHFPAQAELVALQPLRRAQQSVPNPMRTPACRQIDKARRPASLTAAIFAALSAARP